MIFHDTELKDARLIDLEPRGDDRGMFARSFCAREFAAAGLETIYVQQNMSVSNFKGTLRGMHFQRTPDAEVKLIRCLRGAIIDIIVDIRRHSPSFMRHQAFELSASNRRQLYVPRGFAHGFQTLTDDVEVSYLVSAFYAPDSEGGLRHDDPALAIDWPLPVTVISPKDASWPLIERESYAGL